MVHLRRHLRSHQRQTEREVEKRPPDGLTYVLINEVPTGDWGVAGNLYRPRI
jgi:phenylpyruvate tautomerase PptA (4-oxalocrotonate tautomerase family)